MIMKPTWVCPAISMPASRNSSKSWLNFPEAAASLLLVPREEWTTSPAEWLSSAAVWFRSVWASWNVLLQGGSFKDKTHISHTVEYRKSSQMEYPLHLCGDVLESTWMYLYGTYVCVNTHTRNVNKSPSKSLSRTYNVHQQLLACFSNAPEGHVNILLAWQAIHTIIQGVRHCFGHLKHSKTLCHWIAVSHSNCATQYKVPEQSYKGENISNANWAHSGAQ